MSLLESGFSGRKARNSHGDLVEQLGRAIVRGDLPVGQTLPGDAELLARFQVSRTVLREAMKTLSAKGLVTARARVGTRVRECGHWNLFDPDVLTWHLETELDSAFFANISEVRLALEPFAAALASERASPEDISRLKYLAKEMGRPGHTPETLAVADLHFHLAVADTSKNPFLRSVGAIIEAALLAAFRLSSSNKAVDFVDSISENHLRIVEAIEQRDPRAAHAAMEKVIRIGIERVIPAPADQNALAHPWGPLHLLLLGKSL
jgi:DNA-binding FadR family transcriptional regulator